MTALLGPSLILLALLNIYPLVFALSESVHNGNLLQVGTFVGVSNYKTELADPGLWSSLRVTLIFTAAGVLGSTVVGMGLALIFKAGIPFARLFRALLLLSWVVPIVVTAMTWQWLVSTPESPVETATSALGLGDVLFLASPTLAIVTLCTFEIWASFPFMFLMFSAALEGVDAQLYEAAQIDGARAARQFTRITWPLIRKPAYVSSLLMMIFIINDFTSVYLLTGGGPVGATQTLPVYSYLLVFREFYTGRGVVVSILMSIAVVLLSLVLFRQIRRTER